MKFLHGKLKVNKGGKITVNFSKPTRVLVMTEREFKKYRDNITYTYYGGHKESPYEFTAPKSDVWHVVVEKGTAEKPEKITATLSATQATPVNRRPPRSLAHSLAEADAQLDADEQTGEVENPSEE